MRHKFNIYIVLAIFCVLQLLRFPKEALNIDSYAYMQYVGQPAVYLNIGGMLPTFAAFNLHYVLLFLASIGCIYMVYKLALRYASERYATIIALLFSFDPLTWFNLQFGILDKNALTMFLFLLLVYLFIYLDDVKTLLYIIGVLVLFAWAWQGWIFIVAVLMLAAAIKMYINKKYLPSITIFSMFIVMAIMMRPRLLSILFNFGIREAVPGILVFNIMYVFYVLVLFLLMRFSNTRKDSISILYYVAGICFLAVFRMNIIFIPLTYIVMAKFLGNLKLHSDWLPFFYGLFIVCIALSYPFYVREPILNSAMREAVGYADSQATTCLISDWGKGHIYTYLSNKTVLYKGHNTYYDAQMAYMIDCQLTGCSIIYDEDDLEQMEAYSNRTSCLRDKDAVTFEHDKGFYAVVQI